MTIPDSQIWLTPKQVGEAFGHNAEWAYDQIRKGRSNRAGTTGIPARLVRKVGGSIHIHRSFLFPEERSPKNSELTQLHTAPPPPYPHMSDQQVLDLGIAIVNQFMEAMAHARLHNQTTRPPLISDRRGDAA